MPWRISKLLLMGKVYGILVGFVFLCHQSCGQDSAQFSFSAYGEMYYNYDFSKPVLNTRPTYVYNHHRTGEVNVNMVVLRLTYENHRSRAGIGLMAGTYSNANLAAEPGVLKNIYEAYAGVRVSKHRQLWVDAGIMQAHIGFESAISKDSWTLTRSLAADNSPYYEAGVRLLYNNANMKWFAAVLLLNGWQRTQRVAGDHTPAFGTQVTFKPNEKVLLNSSTFIGSDQPDSARRLRYFHDLYGIIQLNGIVGVTVGMDIGMEQKSKGSSVMNLWYTPVIIFKIKATANKFVVVRTEHYNDRGGVIINKINGLPPALWSCSSNLDWKLNENILWRIEGKWMKNKHPIFLEQNGLYVTTNWSAAIALCFSF